MRRPIDMHALVLNQSLLSIYSTPSAWGMSANETQMYCTTSNLYLPRKVFPSRTHLMFLVFSFCSFHKGRSAPRFSLYLKKKCINKWNVIPGTTIMKTTGKMQYFRHRLSFVVCVCVSFLPSHQTTSCQFNGKRILLILRALLFSIFVCRKLKCCTIVRMGDDAFNNIHRIITFKVSNLKLVKFCSCTCTICILISLCV